MHIKITTKYYHAPIRMTKIKTQTMPRVGEDVKELELSPTVGRNVKWSNHY